jgi:transposase InsO family protein
MPWLVKDLMSVRLEFVQLAMKPDCNKRELCRRFGISPTVGYKWLKRFQEGSEEGLKDYSRRPKNSPKQTQEKIERLIVDLRKEHSAWGARTLRRRLKDLGHSQLPAISTITGILHRHGLIEPERSLAAQPFKRFERNAPNQLWQMDFKGHFALSDGRCHPFSAVDDHSRYNVVLQACHNQAGQTVQSCLIEAFRRYGLPDAILCDNGTPWACGGAAEHTGFSVWLMRLGIRVYHGRAFHPQTQGKQERFHRTLQAEVLSKGGWKNCSHVQNAFDQWRPVYNTKRPHHALDMATPISRYKPSDRRYPEQLPPVEYDEHVETRKVDADGFISYQGRAFRAGRAFIGHYVAIEPSQQDGVYRLIFLNQVLKELDLRQTTNDTVP